MASESNAVHLLAGGFAGTVGAVLTCPLEVLKTRLQSSTQILPSPTITTHIPPSLTPSLNVIRNPTEFATCRVYSTAVANPHHAGLRQASILQYLKHIVRTEGGRALFKGLGANVLGVFPSRAVYFCAYAKTKRVLNEIITPDTPLVHMAAAVAAGISSATLTNPIWFVKTRMQLDQKQIGNFTCRECIKTIYKENGMLGFYKGISASYIGVSETVLHFVIYEAVKSRLLRSGMDSDGNRSYVMDFFKFMVAGAVSKSCAGCVAYPTEVVRTRLRESGNKYNSFMQTLLLIFREEGLGALYRGLATQLVRSIPNTAIMMSTYEAVIYLFSGPGVDDDDI